MIHVQPLQPSHLSSLEPAVNTLDDNPASRFVAKFRDSPNAAATLHLNTEVRTLDGRTLRGIAHVDYLDDLRAWTRGSSRTSRGLDLITSLETLDFISISYASIAEYRVGAPLYRENWLNDSPSFTETLAQVIARSLAREDYNIKNVFPDAPEPSSLWPIEPDPLYIVAAASAN